MKTSSSRKIAGRIVHEIDKSAFIPVTNDMIGWHVVHPGQRPESVYVLVGIVYPITGKGRRALIYDDGKGSSRCQCWEDAQFTAPWVVRPRDWSGS